MMNVGSLSTAGNGFTLDTQAGITHLLASIRSSTIAVDHKNELRDLVFLYTNGGKDTTVRLALEQKIAAYQLTPAPQKHVATPTPPPPPIGTYRPAPSFSAPATLVTFAPVAPAPNFTAAPAWQPAPTPVETPVVVPMATIPVATAVPAPAPAPVATPTPSTPTLAADDQQFLRRIREIKALVNEKVGNPVNLVDINNDVGREYMGALLDAMKKLNSGSSAASAMQRLEQAYEAVEKALEAHAKQAPAQTPAPSIPVAPAPRLVVEEAPAPVLPTPVAINTPPAVSVAPLSAPNVSFLDDTPLATTGAGYKEAAPTPPSPVEEPTPWVAEELPKAMPTPPQFSSLAETKEKPKTLTDVPSPASLKSVAVAGDPLFTAEVDDGLQQLLIEWPIFKKSGMFGAGPKGREHPLFKKMAPLQIPLLLAGRFEGATQEIKQSVTDYMNGWRYEQGLIYQQGETFEHYLRRVIRHILDLQNRR